MDGMGVYAYIVPNAGSITFVRSRDVEVLRVPVWDKTVHGQESGSVTEHPSMTSQDKSKLKC